MKLTIPHPLSPYICGRSTGSLHAGFDRFEEAKPTGRGRGSVFFVSSD
jgi:hypothetical protein